MTVMLLALFQVSRILESVLYMDDPRSAFADEYPDHVKAQFVEGQSSIEEVSLGQRADGGLFAGGDGLEGMPKAGSRGRFTSTKTMVFPWRRIRSSFP
jgi:hypothetical protein